MWSIKSLIVAYNIAFLNVHENILGVGFSKIRNFSRNMYFKQIKILSKVSYKPIRLCRFVQGNMWMCKNLYLLT